ncbi:MAG: hypothetical protein UFV24_02735 [Dorea sp.]|uniref:hypothetical protein n=1 Tax=Dorea sp. TaxID=2040332 RepID=UPI002E75996D|nr:hypothetical protein [Dorea sp.]MED9703692.1 hypothetical protein [Dorea sp.]
MKFRMNVKYFQYVWEGVRYYGEKKACPAVKYNYQKLLQLVNEWSKKEYEK